MSNKLKPELYVAWKTVTYRSVIMALIGAVLIFGAVMHVAFPKFTDSTVKAVGQLSAGLLEKVAGLAPPLKGPSAAVSQQAHFTALDGTVERSKAVFRNRCSEMQPAMGETPRTGVERVRL